MAMSAWAFIVLLYRQRYGLAQGVLLLCRLELACALALALNRQSGNNPKWAWQECGCGAAHKLRAGRGLVKPAVLYSIWRA